MIKSTKYLFDKPRSEYEPELTILAKKRIKDAKELIKKLAKNRDELMEILPEEDQKKYIKRYKEVEKSLNWWRNILEEE